MELTSTRPSRKSGIPAEHDLMRRIARGEQQAFEQLYRLHRGRTLGQARALCGSRELAEDLTQECFASVWRNAHLYRPERGSPGAWLAGILRNRATDAWRRASSRPAEVSDQGSSHPQVAPEDAADILDRAAVRAHLAALPREQREVLFLAYHADLTYAQIAVSSGASLGTVKGRGRLGLKKLRAALAEQLPGAAAATAWAG